MDQTVMGLQGLETTFTGLGFALAAVQAPGVTPPAGSAVHIGGENELQKSIEAFGLIANGSSNAGTVPPNCVHVQVQGYPLTGSKRTVRSPWLEVEAVQFWVRANQ